MRPRGRRQGLKASRNRSRPSRGPAVPTAPPLAPPRPAPARRRRFPGAGARARVPAATRPGAGPEAGAEPGRSPAPAPRRLGDRPRALPRGPALRGSCCPRLHKQAPQPPGSTPPSTRDKLRGLRTARAREASASSLPRSEFSRDYVVEGSGHRPGSRLRRGVKMRTVQGDPLARGPLPDTTQSVSIPGSSGFMLHKNNDVSLILRGSLRRLPEVA
jgi:hypothetical protein